MKGKIIGLLSVSCILILLSGCAVAPSWVRHESDTFYCSTTPAIYGVGRSAPQAREERMKMRFASIQARRSVVAAQKEYIKYVLRDFASANDQWFDLDALENEIDDIADVANDRLRMRPVFIDEWQDTRYLPWERRDNRGTIYVLGEQKIDENFKLQLLESLNTSFRAREARVLKADPDTVTVGFAEYLGV